MTLQLAKEDAYLSLMQAMKDSVGSLTPQERKLAEYILQHPREAVHLTITELARLSGAAQLRFQDFVEHFRWTILVSLR